MKPAEVGTVVVLEDVVDTVLVTNIVDIAVV